MYTKTLQHFTLTCCSRDIYTELSCTSHWPAEAKTYTCNSPALHTGLLKPRYIHELSSTSHWPADAEIYTRNSPAFHTGLLKPRDIHEILQHFTLPCWSRDIYTKLNSTSQWPAEAETYTWNSPALHTGLLKPWHIHETQQHFTLACWSRDIYRELSSTSHWPAEAEAHAQTLQDSWPWSNSWPPQMCDDHIAPTQSATGLLSYQHALPSNAVWRNNTSLLWESQGPIAPLSNVLQH
jgi:hypothetical protein